MKPVRAVAAVLLSGLLPTAAAAQALDPEDPPAVVRTGTDTSDRVTIPIQIDGKGPYHFVVDTGSQRTVISRELADSLALQANQRVKILSITGPADVDTVTVPRLSFGTTKMDPIQAPVLSGEHLGAAGLLGLDGLHKKRLILNFKTGRMNISASASRPIIHEPDTIIVEARSKLGQLILLDSTAEGQKVSIILDTGSEYSIGNTALLRKLTRKRPTLVTGPVSIGSVTGDFLMGQWGMIDKVRMGGITLGNLTVVFADAQPFAELGLKDKPALLLGVNALRGFDRVAIDFGRKRVDFLLPDEGSLPSREMASLDTDSRSVEAQALD